MSLLNGLRRARGATVADVVNVDITEDITTPCGCQLRHAVDVVGTLQNKNNRPGRKEKTMATENRYFYLQDKPIEEIKDAIGWEGLEHSDGVIMVLCDHIIALEKKVDELEARIDLIKAAQAGQEVAA